MTDISVLTYETIALIFGIAGIAMLIASSLLFFVFDVRNILYMRLGFAKKREMKRMKANVNGAEIKGSREELQISETVPLSGDKMTVRDAQFMLVRHIMLIHTEEEI